MKNFPPQYNLQDQDVLYFPHIPKTAGMTFRTILEDYFDIDDICPATVCPHFNSVPKENLGNYHLYRGHLTYIDLPKLLPDKNIVHVTVLREPIARLISHYEYIRRTPGDPYHNQVMKMTLEDFTQNLTLARLKKNVQVYHLAKLAKFRLNKIPPDEILAIAKDCLDNLAFAGILERFQDSLFLLSYIFGWKPILNTRKENAAGAAKVKSYEQLPERTLDMIRESTSLDLELYDYATRIFAERYAAMEQDLLQRYAAKLPPDLQALARQSLTPDLTCQLLDKHAEQRYLELQPTESNSALYDFAHALRGFGWHRRETPDQDPAYRWIGPTTAATLDLPLTLTEETDYFLEFRIICTWATAPDILESLTLEVNGQPIEIMTLYRDPGVKLMQAQVPYAVLASAHPFTWVKFQVNRTAPMRTLNPLNAADPRQVGVAINYVHLFPVGLEREKGASLLLFEDPLWGDVADFVTKRISPGERVAAPLAFKVKFLEDVVDSSEFLTGNQEFQWVILHKSMTDKVSALLLKLFKQGFKPVFANEVFVVFGKDKAIPQLAYTLPHVRSLYLGQLKSYIRYHFDRKVKPWYSQRFGQTEGSSSSAR